MRAPRERVPAARNAGCNPVQMGKARAVRGAVGAAHFHFGNSVAAFSSQQDWLCQWVRRRRWKKYGRKLGQYTFE